MKTRAIVGALAVLVLVVHAAGAAPPAPRFDEVSKNVRLSTDPLADSEIPGGEMQAEPHIAIDPTDPRHLLVGAQEGRRADGGAQASGYYASTDAGKTWTTGLIPGLTAASGGPYERASDPVVAFGPDGTAYFASLTVGPDAIVVSRDAPGEPTEWSPPVEVTRATEQGFPDKEWLAVDTGVDSPHVGTLYVTWTDFAATGRTTIRLSRSTDGGSTWIEPLGISGGDEAVQGSVPVVGPDGTVTVVYFDTFEFRIRAATSTDGGITFGDPETVAPVKLTRLPGLRTGTIIPSAFADRSTGRLHVVWQDAHRDTSDIFYVSSRRGGTTWTEPTRVNRSKRGSVQFTAAVTAVGRAVHVLYYDSRDPRGRDDLYNVHYSQSRDGGRSWLRSVRVTPRSFDMDFAANSQGGRGKFLADYIGIVATAARAYGVWVDTRRHQNDVFHSRISR